MIVELAGLPGGGKTTICRAVTAAHGGKGSVSLWRLPPSPAFLLAAWRIALLCLSARPLTANRCLRGFNFLVLLRHYRRLNRTILLDQGLAQKLWSLLADATAHDEDRRLAVLRALKPFAPSAIFWVETDLATAASRMAKRTDGISRYDRLDEESAVALLGRRAVLLRRIVNEMARETGCHLAVLDGMAAPAVNAARLDRYLASGVAEDGKIAI